MEKVVALSLKMNFISVPQDQKDLSIGNAICKTHVVRFPTVLEQILQYPEFSLLIIDFSCHIHLTS